LSYEVLARKHRPRRFEDVVGQRHVVDSLRNALSSGRLHHAYLFTGTRGVGKTTLARILVRALNCERGMGPEPCGECQNCLDIDTGRFPDLIEVDAASRTKVDETRELLDDVHYAPARGRFKVYLIDEVHMFSDKSFNALLKTLEEPPAHVKFLLATTEARKLPITVLSRCLQFTLKHVGVEPIAQHLAQVLAAEGIEFEPAACRLLAEAAAGSVRDSLSLLDQAVIHGGGRLETAKVAAMLGVLDRGQVLHGLETLVAGDADALLDWIALLAEVHDGFSDFEGLLVELLRLLLRVAVLQQAPQQAVDDEDARLLAVAETLAPEDVQLYYQIGVQGRRDLNVAPDPRSGLEMTLLRMLAFRPASAGPSTPVRSGPASSSVRPPARAGSAAPTEAAPSTRVAPRVEPPPAATATAIAAPMAAAGGERLDDSFDWASLAGRLEVSGLQRELAQNAWFLSFAKERLSLAIAPVHAHLLNDRAQERLQQALRQILGAGLTLGIAVHDPDQGTESPAARRNREQQERLSALRGLFAAHPFVQAVEADFGARLDEVALAQHPAVEAPLTGSVADGRVH
jgi:DNA polymerase III subunit gamma/tau